MDLSLVLTLYNEGKILKENLDRIYFLLTNSNLDFEIIFVDDQSQDFSFQTAQDFARHKKNCFFIRHQKNIGRGGSVSEGLAKAQGEVVGFIDTDLEVSPEKIPEAVRLIQGDQADVVTGLRMYRFHWASLFRHLATRSYRFLVRLCLNLPLKDTETGFKFFRREKISPILSQAKDKGWFWDTEIMALSHRAHLKILEIPVIFKRCLAKKSTVNIFRDSARYFFKLMAFTIKKNEKDI